MAICADLGVKQAQKKASRALPALSNSPAEQTGELNSQPKKFIKGVGATVDSAHTMGINTQGWG